MEKLKELDRKILIGLGLTVAFLIIWLITLPSVSYNTNPFDSYSSMNESQKTQQILEDTDNYNNAILKQDNTYCNKIVDRVMKSECLTKAPAKSGNVVEEKALSQSEIEDASNYNNAVLKQDNTYCNNIQNTQMKNDCLNQVSSTPSSITIVEQELTPSDVEDANNYNKAIILNDKSYCEKIIDEQMKTDCMNR